MQSPCRPLGPRKRAEGAARRGGRKERFPGHHGPPSSAPAGLAVGFGPKESSPTLAFAGDSPRGLGKSEVGPPPPGATRGLGVIGILLSLSHIRRATTVVNDRQHRRSEGYSPKCVEKLFGKWPKTPRACYFGGEKRPIWAVLTFPGRLRIPISEPIPIFQTVSEGKFSEIRLQDIA